MPSIIPSIFMAGLSPCFMTISCTSPSWVTEPGTSIWYTMSPSFLLPVVRSSSHFSALPSRDSPPITAYRMVYGSFCLKTALYSAQRPTSGNFICWMQVSCAPAGGAAPPSTASVNSCILIIFLDPVWEVESGSMPAAAGELLHQLAYEVLRVAEQHPGAL